MKQMSQLKRLRWTVRFVLVLGIAASVAANVLHARPMFISQAISAWPPLALLLTVELCSRIPVVRRLLSAVRIGATAAIASIAAWISYWHMAATASRFGETGSSAYLLPLTVDGLIVVASVSLVELGSKIRSFEESPVVAVQQLAANPASPPAPVSPAPAGVVTPMQRERVARPTGRGGPQVVGPSKPSPLTGRVLMEEPPQI